MSTYKHVPMLLLIAWFLGFVPMLEAQTIPPEIPTNGLVGWWPFNGNANDESGGGHHGTVYGAALVNDRYGVNTSAYSFDGIDDYIEVASTAALSVNNAYTVSVWFNVDVFSFGPFPDQHILVSKTVDGSWYGGFEVFVIATNGVRHVGNIGGNNFYFGKDGLVTKKWYHVAYTFTGTEISCFFDGVLVESGPLVGALQTSGTPLRFGRRGGAGNLNCWYDGIIDDIAIWNRALTATEIENLARASTSIPMRSDTLALGSYGSRTKIVGPSSGSYQYALPSVSGTLTTSQADPLPYGTVIMYASATPPAGYLECNGQIVSRSTYAGLFAVVGTSYGAGNGSTTFAVPTLTHPVLRYGIRAQ